MTTERRQSGEVPNWCGSSSMSLLHVAKCLRTDLGHPHRVGQSCQRGQIAVSLIVVVALTLLLSSFLMNLGEVARLKTATANAADAGALAAASWVASGENGVAVLAKAQWIIYLIGQLVMIGPWCVPAGYIYTILFMIALEQANFVNLYLNGEKVILDAVWDAAQKSALFTALANAGIDDPKEQVSHDIKTLFESGSVPSEKTFHWKRQGANGHEENSSVTVKAQMGSEPDVSFSPFGPISIFWAIPCIYVCCWGPVFGLDSSDTKLTIPTPIMTITLPLPTIKSCGQICSPIVIMNPPVKIIPQSIDAGSGKVTVTVIRKRESGNTLGFWKMRYPTEVKSVATAAYNETSIDMWPSQNSKAVLTKTVP